MTTWNEDAAESSVHGVSTLTTPSNDNPNIILHVDCDCFYASCEELRNPELSGEPVIIGMGYDEDDPSGAVATANYEARKHGVESAMAIGKALTVLPRREHTDASDPSAPDPNETAHYLPVDMEYYESVGSDVHNILNQFADVLEPISIDEAYLDCTTQTSWETVDQYAKTLKETIKEEVGIPVSVGAAPTKSAAKVASDHDKPDGLVVIEPGTVREFFAPLDIEEVHGIGPVTAGELREMGIETAGDLASADQDTLVEKFGTRGKEAHQRARGHDPREVAPPDDPKSISNESSFGTAVNDWEQKQDRLQALIDKVTSRADEQDALYQTIGIKAIEPPFDANTRAHTLPGPISNRELVETIATELFEEFRDTPVRKIGVRLSNLSFSEGDQVSLTEWGTTEDVEPGEYSQRHMTSKNSDNESNQGTLADYY